MVSSGDTLDYVEPCLPCASVSVETMRSLMPKTLCYRPFQACPSVSVNKTFNPKHCAQNPFTNASEMHQARVGICLDIGVKQLLMIGEFWIRTVDRAAVALMRRTSGQERHVLQVTAERAGVPLRRIQEQWRARSVAER